MQVRQLMDMGHPQSLTFDHASDPNMSCDVSFPRNTPVKPVKLSQLINKIVLPLVSLKK